MEARLPDGSEHASWEQTLTFSKTYYVDNMSPRADDAGPGSKTRPFRTISKAAQVLEPGQRVVIASGTYRECVRPARGGSGPAQMISYEAAPGARVFIKGSEILKDGWQQESVSIRRFGPAAQNAPQITVWRHDLTGAMFPDAYNPFALASAPADREWLDTRGFYYWTWFDSFVIASAALPATTQLAEPATTASSSNQRNPKSSMHSGKSGLMITYPGITAPEM